jgi:hypothetical protein
LTVDELVVRQHRSRAKSDPITGNVTGDNSMSAIQSFFRALLHSPGKVREKYSDDQNRDKPDSFGRNEALFSGRGIICFGAGIPRSLSSRKGRTLI